MTLVKKKNNLRPNGEHWSMEKIVIFFSVKVDFSCFYLYKMENCPISPVHGDTELVPQVSAMRHLFHMKLQV
jgi:hypothetical protein